MIKFILNTILCLSLVSPIFVSEAEARGRRSFSSSRSFSRSFSTSRPKKTYGNYSRSKKSSSNYTKPKTTSSTSRSSSTSGSFSNKSTKSSSTNAKTSTSRKTSAADKSLAQKSNQTRKTFSSRSDAVRSFETANKQKYSSTYKTKPTNRPDHIPKQTTYNNRRYDVDYNPKFGGYGYYGPSGSWVTYCVFRDAAMITMLMNSQNYRYRTPMASTYPSSHYTHHRRSSGLGSIFGFIFFIGIAGAAVSIIQQNTQGMKR